MDVLQEFQKTVTDVAARAGAAVVGVGAGRGAGSGLVVGNNRVLTNAHHVRASQTPVAFPDGRRLSARVTAADVTAELAVLEVDTGEVEPVDWSPEADALALGTAVFALANPGGRGVHVTFGLVSATDRSFRGPEGRRITGAVAHTAPLVSGSSGGPLLDASGRLVGVNTHRLGDGFYLAIPTGPEVRQRVDALARGESRQRARLGLAIAPPQAARRLRRSVGLPDRDGLLVRDVADGGPADRAGLRRGDLLVEAAGTALTSADELFAVLDDLVENATLPLTVVRGADELAVSVTFSATREEGSV